MGKRRSRMHSRAPFRTEPTSYVQNMSKQWTFHSEEGKEVQKRAMVQTAPSGAR